MYVHILYSKLSNNYIVWGRLRILPLQCVRLQAEKVRMDWGGRSEEEQQSLAKAYIMAE
jgi:hypothetical protein